MSIDENTQESTPGQEAPQPVPESQETTVPIPPGSGEPAVIGTETAHLASATATLLQNEDDMVSRAASLPSAPADPVAPAGGRPSMWRTLLLGVLLVAGSAGATYLLTTDRPAGTAVVVEDPTGEQFPDFVAGDEPIADAAAVILPSVVQIQTGTGLGSGVGSGVIYDSDGLILTAAHVVGDNDTVTVRLSDGEEVEGTVLGGTSGADVAVVQVDRTGLPAAELALDDDPRVGQMAIALGSPWGLRGTVTAGIISAVNQSIPQGDSARSVLQTDAAINPGNSGGPLVDREGRVLGINVSIFSLSGANDGVGFAVPIAVASDVAERVVAGEAIESAFLGVTGEDVETGRAGAVITEVTPGTAAADAGIEVDDLVISLDGVRIQGITDLAAQVRTHQPGATVEMVVIRDGEQLTYEVTLGERPEDLR
ncbi:MAG TPA: trypsin-like peptidase domain-containing protein [Acidimicrobiia bacterium]|jgi:S1-C subfamily serine protease